MVRALLVDDDLELGRLLGELFQAHDVTLEHAADGPSGLARATTEPFDVVLLDVMLPGLDGFEVCRAIRERSAVPIVMLTARGDDGDRIQGLEIGADDYLPKPFNPRELVARVRAVLRRARPEAPPSGDRLVVGDLTLDPGTFTATRGGAPIELTSFEFRVLLALARRAGKPVTREVLARAVHEDSANGPKSYDPSVDRSLDVHVSRLRQKLEDEPARPQRIKTVRGVGYVLTKPS